MKKRFWNSKRILSLLLALSLVMGQTGFVSAETVQEAPQTTNVTISVNSAQEIAPETAYNGTPSKVIGLSGRYNEEGKYVRLEWVSLSTDNKFVSPDGNVIEIGYEVEENDKIVRRNPDQESPFGYELVWANYFYSNLELERGDSVKYRVRGLYYVYDEDEDGLETLRVVSAGPWSDYYTYKIPAEPTEIKVTGVKAEIYESDYLSKAVKFSWNPVPEASSYYVQYISSSEKLTGLTEDNWSEFYGKSGTAYDEFETANPDASYNTGSSYAYNLYYSLGFSSDYYYYVRVKANTSLEEYTTGGYSSICMFDGTLYQKVQTEGVETIKDFRVEYDESGEIFDLKWTAPKQSQNMIIYAYESPSFPKYYYYSRLNARGEKEGGYGLYSLGDVMDPVLRQTINRKVQYYMVSGSNERLHCSKFDLEYGKTYYFVAHTYDTSNQNVDRDPLFTLDGVTFTRYVDMSAPSKIISAKIKVPVPVARAEADKTRITLHMNINDAYTGYEIYRKSGKKYKKIATVTDNVYVDSDVKSGTKYQYKVRAYNYNKNTKKTAYSGYEFVTAQTVAVKYIDLVVKHKTKKKLSLKWNKVPGAYKYEIYRTEFGNANPNDYYFVDTAPQLSDKWELIKTINKASKTSYVDKKITPGQYYGYIVMAYYKTGKQVSYVSDYYIIGTMLSAPEIEAGIKGTTVKYSWNKNKYVAGYEVKYRVYDKNRLPVSDWKTIKTTGTSFSVNVPAGGYAVLSARAYSSTGCYSSWTSNYTVCCGLAAPTGIKATNVTVKNTSGQSVNAVKITWKPVSGAKYYGVYRTTKLQEYDEDTKTYYIDPDKTPLIAKESNDDEKNNEVPYSEYYGEYGSVVGTTAYDFAQLDAGVNYYYYVVAFGDRDTYTHTNFGLQNSYAYGSGKPSCVTYKKATVKINKITNKKKGKAVVTWTKVAGAKKYYVYRSEKKKGGYRLLTTTKKTTFTDKKVKKGKTYYYKIVVVGANALKADYVATSKVKKVKIKK